MSRPAAGGRRGVAAAQTRRPSRRYAVQVRDADEARSRLRTGKTDLVVVPAAAGGTSTSFDPTRPESVLARDEADDALQRAAGRDATPADDRAEEMDEPAAATSTSSCRACWAWA